VCDLVPFDLYDKQLCDAYIFYCRQCEFI